MRILFVSSAARLTITSGPATIPLSKLTCVPWKGFIERCSHPSEPKTKSLFRHWRYRVSDKHTSPAEPKPLRVLHVLEATLGGTLRYMENIVEATEGLDLVSGFAYGTARADSRLKPFLECISSLGWSSYPVDMTRQVEPLHDFKACLRLCHVIAHFAPDIIHCHSSKAGALGRVAAFLQRDRPARVYSPHALAAPLGSIYLKIEKLLSKSTDRFVAVSDSERREIINFSLAPEGSVSVVYPSVDSAYFQPMSRDVAREVL